MMPQLAAHSIMDDWKSEAKEDADSEISFHSVGSEGSTDDSSNETPKKRKHSRIFTSNVENRTDTTSGGKDLVLTDLTNLSNTKNDIPKRFVDGCLGDMAEAERRWKITDRWRKEANIDGILSEKQKHFFEIKRLYPHYFHKRTKSGFFIYYELPGQADFANVFKQNISLIDMQHHYVFVTEYLWRVMDPREEGKLFTIIDVKGAKLSSLAGNTVKLFQKCADIIQSHYPERSLQTLVINAPWWFQTAWAILAPFINPRTKEKIKILGSDYIGTLLKSIEASNIPLAYGGTDPTPIGQSNEERNLSEYVVGI